MRIEQVETLYDVYQNGNLIMKKRTLDEAQSYCMYFSGSSYKPSTIVLRKIK